MAPFYALKALLPIIAILGFSNTISWKTKISSQYAIFMVTFSILLLQFFATLIGIISLCSSILLWSGGVLFSITFIKNIVTRHSDALSQDTLIVNGIYLIFLSISLVLVSHLHLIVIDDFSYWATISKYLFLFDQLPTAPLPYAIDPSHLSYTPGLATFQYLFYFASGQYSAMSGHLAQSTLFFSCFLVLFRPRQLLASLSQIALSMIILIFASGFLLGRMQADAVLAAILFSTLALIQSEENLKKKLIIIFAPILSLYLVKEIGLLLAIFCLTSLLFCSYQNKKSWAYLILTGFSLFLLHWVWTTHYHNAGFATFAQNISFSTVLNSLNPFNPNYQFTQFLTLKAIFFDAFDSILRAPYILIYFLIWVLWRSIQKNYSNQNSELARKTKIIKNCFIVYLLIYLLLIYFLEALTFGIGHNFQSLLAFSRYYNILFTPFFMFVANTWFFLFEEKYWSTNPKKHSRVAYIFLSVCPLLVLLGAAQRLYGFNRYDSTRILAKKIIHQIGQDPTKTICITKVPKPTYEVMDPLQYYLLPTRLKLLSEKELPHDQCNFILLYSKAQG